jgi:glycerol-3-phosphate dehydrogenase
MQRNLPTLSNKQFDVLVIGGGIYGACVAWEAQSRGLSVALVEKSDFASATSANSLKIIHGGLRYLQNLDIKRMRESIAERSTLMHIAPHLVHPLPVLLPIYGHGFKGKEVMFAALTINDLVSFNRNRRLDAQKHIPRGRIISRKACLELTPGIEHDGLTGAAVFYDAQVYNSERLVLSFIHSAVKSGATIANYVEVVEYLKNGSQIYGVRAEDKLSGERFDIRAKVVVNTVGPWSNSLRLRLNPNQPKAHIRFAKAINVITRSLFDTYAVGLSNRSSAIRSGNALHKERRFYFIAPWRNHSIIGTDYIPCDDSPDAFKITEADVERFISKFNGVYPAANLTREDVTFVHGGLLPITGVDDKTGAVRLLKHYQIYDHRQEGLQGLVTVTGVKYTTARNVAERIVDKITDVLEKKISPSVSAKTPLHDGHISDFSNFLQHALTKHQAEFTPQTIQRLIYNYGSSYAAVLQHLEKLDTPYSDEDILRAEIQYAVQEEMALKLTDVILRRTELGTIGYPGDQKLRLCADFMGRMLGWTEARISQEMQDAKSAFWRWENVDDRANELAAAVIQ